ncbi:hypothetical protein [Actinopolymorpha rutila]|uniref:Uncharacterized protein n=1 Tax=Actinopolymorpha rutila TaxID=446787 RepID=A0A852Z5I8_9ACTN|nr:hypothetical protein [Actinopolymorpha rutila]NYH87643.1 hypothetical protein [Actinopolymorpha rutila]
MTDVERLQRMVADLRAMRDQCEPKSREDQRYFHFSNAASQLLWLIGDLQAEEG